MYSPTPRIAALWRALLARVSERAAGAPLEVFDYPPPLPLGPLWARPDKGAVYMCGLPFALADAAPVPVAVALPSSPRYQGQAVYWSDLVVRADSALHDVADTFGRRIALTTPESQSGYHALLQHLADLGPAPPAYEEAVGPTVTFMRNLHCVLDGAADVAPIDSYGFDLLCRHHPDLVAQVRVIGHTRAMPSPLLVGSKAHPGLRAALLDAHRDASCREAMDGLLIERFVEPDVARYRDLAHAHARGVRYWREHAFAARGNAALGLDASGRLRAGN